MTNLITALMAFFITSFYSLSYKNIDGDTVSMNAYAGKKVLIVNISTNSMYASQIGQLQQLRTQFGDSVAIVAFPSDYFNNEPHTNAEIKTICQTQYGATFNIAEKTAVGGTQISSVYNWLTHLSENGAGDEQVIKDFQKFLISKEGDIIGVYPQSMQPTDPRIINALNRP